MKKLRTNFLARISLALYLVFLGVNAQAQLSTISYTADDAVVTQNFDSLNSVPNTTLYTNTTSAIITAALVPCYLSSATVTNKSTLAGWQITKLSGNTAAAGTILLAASLRGNGVSIFF